MLWMWSFWSRAEVVKILFDKGHYLAHKEKMQSTVRRHVVVQSQYSSHYLILQKTRS